MKRLDPELLKAAKNEMLLQSLKRNYKSFSKENDDIILTDKINNSVRFSLEEFRSKFPVFSNFVFSDGYVYATYTIGEGFIGGHKGKVSFRYGTEPNFQFAFFDLYTGEIKKAFDKNISVSTGFKNKVAELTQILYGTNFVDLLVFLPNWKIKPKNIKYYNEEPEEDDDDPFISSWDDGYDSYMDGEADSYFYD